MTDFDKSADELEDSVLVDDLEMTLDLVSDRDLISVIEGDPETLTLPDAVEASDNVADFVLLPVGEKRVDVDAWALYEILLLDAGEKEADTELDSDSVGDLVGKRELLCVTETVFVTPVGNVDGDALPVLAEEPDAVGVAGFDCSPECDPVVERVDVLDDVLDDVSVADT